MHEGCYEGEEDENEDHDMSAWERAFTEEKSWESLQEDESGLLHPIDNKMLSHAQYRQRIRFISSTSVDTRNQKGLIRYLYVVMYFFGKRNLKMCIFVIYCKVGEMCC